MLSQGRSKMEAMSAGEEGELHPEHERALAEAGRSLPAPDARLIAAADDQLVRRALQRLPISAVNNRIEARQMDATLIIEPEISRTLHLVYAQRHKTSKPFLAVRAALRSIIADMAKANYGGPTKQRIGPFNTGFSCSTAR